MHSFKGKRLETEIQAGHLRMNLDGGEAEFRTGRTTNVLRKPRVILRSHGESPVRFSIEGLAGDHGADLVRLS